MAMHDDYEERLYDIECFPTIGSSFSKGLFDTLQLLLVLFQRRFQA